MDVTLSNSKALPLLSNYIKLWERNVTIVAMNNESIQTSGLMLAWSSCYIKELIISATNHQVLEPVTLFLTDYDLKLVNVLLEYLSTGFGNCQSQEDYDKLCELLNLLKIKTTFEPSIEVKEPIIKSEVVINEDSFSEFDAIDKSEVQDQILEEPTVKMKLRKFQSDSECHICLCVCGTDDKLRSHFQDRHPNERPFICEYNNCVATFNYRHTLRTHIKLLHLQKSKKTSPAIQMSGLSQALCKSIKIGYA